MKYKSTAGFPIAQGHFQSPAYMGGSHIGRESPADYFAIPQIKYDR
jgi:hypothetical protein